MRNTCPDFTKSILLARYRSGSNLLNESLHQVPEVKVLGEIFNLVTIERDPRRYLDPAYVMETFSTHREDFKKAVIFKLMYGQTTRDELEESYWGPNVSSSIKNQIVKINAWLNKEQLPATAFEHLLDQIKRDRDIRIIHLVRHNQLESYVSFQLALREDNWIGETYRTSRQGLHVDREDLERYFKRGKAFFDSYTNLFRHHEMLEITYEDLSFHYADTFKKVCDFLQLKIAKPPVPPIKKQNTREMSEVISNYDAIYEYFKDTRWGEYFTRAAG
jgi:LPS sulfotransferase NodH